MTQRELEMQQVELAIQKTMDEIERLELTLKILRAKNIARHRELARQQIFFERDQKTP